MSNESKIAPYDPNRYFFGNYRNFPGFREIVEKLNAELGLKVLFDDRLSPAIPNAPPIVSFDDRGRRQVFPPYDPNKCLYLYGEDVSLSAPKDPAIDYGKFHARLREETEARGEDYLTYLRRKYAKTP